MKKKIAIILFNLGGPDSLKSVKPFLFNLFYDKNIIPIPKFFRYFISWLISSKREKTAKEIYSKIGGKSPLLDETKSQLKYLEEELEKKINDNFKIFICMRHWHPMSSEVIKKISEYSPDEIILLPLYPHFSTTTSGSSIEDFKKKIVCENLSNIICKTVCCYPEENDFINSHVEIINDHIKNVKNQNNYRLLFSAHGLPKKIIDAGDPYQYQIELTVKKIVEKLKIEKLDYKITYQSRVGPLEWIGPDTESEIEILAKQSKDIVIVPIAFVSEHVETLVELDIEYREIANSHGVNYIRVPTLRTNKLFVKSLSDIIMRFIEKKNSFTTSSYFSRVCPKECKECICKV